METDDSFVKPAEVHVESERTVYPEVQIRISKEEQSHSNLIMPDTVKSGEESSSTVSDADMLTAASKDEGSEFLVTEQSSPCRSDAVKSGEQSSPMVSDGNMSETVESESEDEGGSVTSEENEHSAENVQSWR